MPTLPLFVTPDPDEPRAIDVRLDVEIAGEIARAVLDTGGGTSIIPTTPHTEHLDVLGPAPGHGLTGTASPDDLVVVPTVCLGSVDVRDIRVCRMPRGDGRPPSIGMDVIGRHRWHFRFRSQAVDIDDATPTGATLAPLDTLPTGQPVVPVRFGPIETRGLWDTGAALTFVDESFARHHPQLFELSDTSDGVDSSGAEFVARMATMAPCEIGGRHVDSTPCAIFDLSAVNENLETPIGIGIGTPLITRSDWFFDFPAGVWAALE